MPLEHRGSLGQSTTSRVVFAATVTARASCHCKSDVLATRHKREPGGDDVEDQLSQAAVPEKAAKFCKAICGQKEDVQVNDVCIA